MNLELLILYYLFSLGLAKVSADNKLFYSITIATLYISLGPWALGYILDDNLGLLFPWGLFIHGHILPADVTHLYGVVFMFPYIGKKHALKNMTSLL